MVHHLSAGRVKPGHDEGATRRGRPVALQRPPRGRLKPSRSVDMHTPFVTATPIGGARRSASWSAPVRPQARGWGPPPRAGRGAWRFVARGPPLRAIGPAANWRGKQWRAERFAALARRLTAADGKLPGGRIAVLAAA